MLIIIAILLFIIACGVAPDFMFWLGHGLAKLAFWLICAGLAIGLLGGFWYFVLGLAS